MTKTSSKRATTPTKASLRAIPEIDFAQHQVKRNRFAMRVQKTGVQLVHEEPSRDTLAEIPEVDFANAPLRRRTRSQTKAATITLQIGKGRPPRGSEVGATSVRSIRLPASVWRSLEQRAARQRMTVHAVLRNAVVDYLDVSPPRRKSA